MTKPIQLRPVQSSNLAAVGFDAPTKRLHVRFLGNPALYEYADISEQTYKALMDAKSVGGYFAAHIKQLPFTKVD